MAKNEKADKRHAVLNYIIEEHKWEGYALFLIGLILTVLGVYIFENDIVKIDRTDWWIFDSPNKIKAVAISLMIVGAGTMLFSAWPFYSPSIGEMKKVTWPNKKKILNHSLRVFGFIIFVSFVFILVGYALDPVFAKLYELGA